MVEGSSLVPEGCLFNEGALFTSVPVADMSQMEFKEEQYTWYQLSPRHLEHRVRLPTAITLHKLVPKLRSTTYVPQLSSSVHMYKHLSQDEIEKAQAKARNFLIQDRLSKISQMSRKVDNEGIKENERNPTTKKASPMKLIKPDEGGVKVRSGKERKFTRLEANEQLQARRPSLPVYKGIGESGLRTRQISRLAPQIITTLTDLESILIQPALKDFVMPHETEIKRKRWEDFLHSAGRTLFSLKREIFQLERSDIRGERNNSKNLRIMATSTRTLHKLLLALKTHAPTAFISESGRRLHAELVAASQRLFEILIVAGIRIPKIKYQTKKSSILEVPEESSSELPSEIASSEVDSHTKSVLHPNFVRERIACLANQKLNKKRWEKHGNRPESIPRNEQVGKEMTINLQDNQESTNNKISISHKQLKYVHTRKLTIASGPKTKHGRRPQPVGKPVENQVQGKLVERESKKMPRNILRRTLPHKGDTEQLEKLQHQLQSEDEAVVDQENEITVAPNSSKGMPVSSSPRPLHHSIGKVVSEKYLVERTADAIVDRLLPLINQEIKKVEDGCAAPASMLDITDPSVQKQASQIHYLLDRVYIIEEDWKKVQDTVSEISKRMERAIQNPETNLQMAIEKARRLMDSVGTNHRLTNEARVATEKILDYGFFLKKNFADENPFSEQGSRSVMINISKSSYSDVNEGSISLGNLNVNEEQKLTSIADQIRQQKEEFWESLIKRGFMKPQDVTVEGAEAAKEVMESMQSKAQLDSTAVAEVSVPRKAIIINNEPRVQEINRAISKGRASLTNAKRNQTLSNTQVCQEAQVGFSLLSSYSSSDGSADQSTHLSEKSNSTYSTSHQSSDQSKSELESFPSYDGLSNGE
ncbi:uncharacterized protein LOC125039581 isoform X2 [Penaeus chinensis]|uniref:uncharacterized protein LOC125039581 isoform X2 n=1 Tax=Penaeus chinensis TaxID=139456 RepID=UPI001FB6D659|nr:uncharacterized protein LOC125039581 isoform X2 [Penaeus chinensis]